MCRYSSSDKILNLDHLGTNTPIPREEDFLEHTKMLLTLGGGLTFLSMLAGRVFQDVHGTHPNIYWISLADSGTGKEHARRINKRLAAATGLMGYIGDNVASGEGLEDAMYAAKKKLFMIDEMDTLFNCLKQKKNCL